MDVEAVEKPDPKAYAGPDERPLRYSGSPFLRMRLGKNRRS
jgi:hypothetical protein